jgi:serine acetyltransferase
MPAKGLRQRLRRLIQTGYWHMDIHPTAWIANDAYIDRTNPRGVHIGRNCLVDSHAVVLSHDMVRGLSPHTRIGEGTVVGARAIVMPGVNIGRNCEIMPGSVVINDIKDGARVIGNPARVVE